MKPTHCDEQERGLTLVDLLVVMAVLSVLTILVFMGLPAPSQAKARAPRIQCVNNLKQIFLAERDWEADHGDKYIFNVSQTNGGAMEFASGPNEFKFFQAMSKELSTPKLLFCPPEAKRFRQWTTNFATLNNSNISYFINRDASETNPQAILSGDRNITNGTPIKNGILELTNYSSVGWTAELHKNVGNLLLSDGSVQQVSQTGLRMGVQNTNVSTNHLLMPILAP